MTPVSTTLDVVLLMTSASAVLYCWQLGRRLKALHTLKTGVGEAIVNLSDQIAKSRAATEEITGVARQAIADLDAALDRVSRERQMTEDLLSVLDGQVARGKGRLTQSLKTAEEIAARLATVTDRARQELKALTRGVEIANRVHAITRERSGEAMRQTRERTADVQPIVGDARRRDPADNPFLKAIKAG